MINKYLKSVIHYWDQLGYAAIKSQVTLSDHSHNAKIMRKEFLTSNIGNSYV